MQYTILIMIIVAYLLGSLSGSAIFSYLLQLPNPSKHGSYNPGATNMLRINGRFPGLCVLLFDMLKGLVPVYIAYRLNIAPFYLGIIGIAACLGHIFPCFFHFNGGKGVATALGSMVLIGFDFTGLFAATWGITLVVTGYSSLASIMGFLCAPLYVWIIRPELTLPVAMLSCLIILRHQSNIQRLIDGQENKIFTHKNKA